METATKKPPHTYSVMYKVKNVILPERNEHFMYIDRVKTEYESNESQSDNKKQQGEQN